jgi:hypothetical protein
MNHELGLYPVLYRKPVENSSLRSVEKYENSQPNKYAGN